MVAAIRTEPDGNPGEVAIAAALDHGLRRAIWYSLNGKDRVRLVKEAIREALK